MIPINIKSPFLNIKCTLYPKTVILGSSGSGKSTLLKYLINNQTSINTHYSYNLMPQKNHLFDIWNVIENLANPIIIVKKICKKQAYENSLNLLKKFKLDHKQKTNINLLSGGEIQRICLIRAILFNYDLLLLDEPTSALDLQNKKIIEDILKEINFILVTHDIDLAHNIGQYFIYMQDGLIIEEGTNILLNPQTKSLQTFLNTDKNNLILN